MPLSEEKATFFATPAKFRAWLEKHHTARVELWVGLYKRDSGKPSITWPEAVDAALCYGWIDGVRKSIDAASYKIRFTPRKPTSNWSAINIKRVRELTGQGLMRPMGLAAFAQRADERSAIYAYEQRKAAELGAEYEKRFRADAKAWEFFQAQAPWYRRTATYWVVSAKRPETQVKRLEGLMVDSARGQRIDRLKPPGTQRRGE